MYHKKIKLSPEIVQRQKEERIRQLAYKKWESSGAPIGNDWYFWFDAEKEQEEKRKQLARHIDIPSLPRYISEVGFQGH